MWETIVQTCLDEKVDALLIAGDVLDHRNRFFEATGPLESGIKRLEKAGIDIFAVAGNHDWDVLPQVADSLASPRFHLLGRGGRWEEARLEREGRTLLRVQGWSFPEAKAPESPLNYYHLDPQGEVPLVGLLHCDLDAAESKYAPVATSELAARGPFDLWALGHIHVPRHERLTTGGQFMYPGSPQALDPGEPGQHGPWLVEVHGRGDLRCRQLPLAKVRYETVSIDIDGAEDEEAVNVRLITQFHNHARRLAEETPAAEWLNLRLMLEGETPQNGRLDDLLERVAQAETSYQVASGTAVIERARDHTRPAIDLAELAGRGDPPGMLAALLLRLEEESPAPGSDNTAPRSDDILEQLVEQAYRKMREVHNATTYQYQEVRGKPHPKRQHARQALREQGRRMLAALLAQVEPREEAAR